MVVVVTAAADTVTVEASGELDIATAPHVLDALNVPLADDAIKNVIFDLRGVSFMDSSGVKVLIYARNRLLLRDGSVTVTNANPAIVKLIRILGLDTELNLQEPGTAPPPPSAAVDEL